MSPVHRRRLLLPGMCLEARGGQASYAWNRPRQPGPRPGAAGMRYLEKSAAGTAKEHDCRQRERPGAGWRVSRGRRVGRGSVAWAEGEHSGYIGRGATIR